jgi:hypothetical protein
MNLTERLAAIKVQEPPKLVPVRMSPFVRALREKRLPVKVLWNGAWQSPQDEGAA